MEGGAGREEQDVHGWESGQDDVDEPVELLLPNDVLIGRGTPYNEWQGNQHFRSLVQERKSAYNSASKNEMKKRLAREFLDYMKQSVDARFLRLAETGEKVDDIISDGVWTVVEDDVALEKIKQAFRQHPAKPKRETKAKENVAGGTSTKLESGIRRDTASSRSLRKSRAKSATQRALERVRVPEEEMKPRAKSEMERTLERVHLPEEEMKPRAAPRATSSSMLGSVQTQSPDVDRITNRLPSKADRAPDRALKRARVPDEEMKPRAAAKAASSSTLSLRSEAARAPSHASPVLPPTLLRASVVDPRSLLLSQQDALDLLSLDQQQQAAPMINNRFSLGNNTMSAERMAHIIQQDVRQFEIQEMMREQNIPGAPSTGIQSDASALEYIQNRLNHDAKGTSKSDDEEDAVHALCALSFSDSQKSQNDNTKKNGQPHD